MKSRSGYLVTILVVAAVGVVWAFDLDLRAGITVKGTTGVRPRSEPRLINAMGNPHQVIDTFESALFVENIYGEVRLERDGRRWEPGVGDVIDRDLTIWLGYASAIVLKGEKGDWMSISGHMSKYPKGGMALVRLDVRD